MSDARGLDKSLTVKILKYLIDAAWYLTLFATGLLMLMIAAFAAGLKPTHLQVSAPVKLIFVESVEADEDEPGFIPFNQRPVITHVQGMANVLVDPRDRVFKGYITVNLLFVMGGLLLGMYNLRQFFRTVRKGDPFNRKNPSRIRWIGALVMAAGPFMQISLYMQAAWILRDYDLPGINWELAETDWSWTIPAGLIIVVIGMIFDMGVKLQQEQKLTI